MSPTGAKEVCNPSFHVGGNHRCRWPWGVGQPAWDGRRQVQNRRALIRLKLLSNIEFAAAGSLKILKEIVVHPDIRKAITQMGGIELMVGVSYLQSKIALMANDKTFITVTLMLLFTQVRILSDSNKHLKLHAAESLSKLAKYKKVVARKWSYGSVSAGREKWANFV